MKALVFTHPPDYEIARVATEAWSRLGVEVTWAIEPQHETPYEQKFIRTKAPRGGNLNGFEFVEEMLELMSGFDFKADSDTLPFSLEWAQPAAPLVGLQGHPNRSEIYGCCWHMKRAEAPNFLRAHRENPKLCENARGAEDLTMDALGKIVGAHIHPFQLEGGVLAGWNWNTRLSEEEYLRRFQVINVQRTGRGTFESQRKEVARKMRSLLDKSFSTK